MPLTSSLHHLALTAADVAASARVYDLFLIPLGYQRHFDRPHFAGWTGMAPEILMYQATDEHTQSRHTRDAPGLHHIALHADSREHVQNIFQTLKDVEGVNILDAPAEYPHYAPGYYALYFKDLDGIKFEVAHIPNPTGH